MLFGGLALASIAGIVNLVCFILVVVQMFQRGQNGLGILCIILGVCTGVGLLIAFVYGWVKAGEWNLKNVMMFWTVGWVVLIVGYAMAFAGGFSMATDPNFMKGLQPR